MGMVAVISRTAGSTSSKRRALTREAERLAAEKGSEATVLINLSGRGDKDMGTAIEYFGLGEAAQEDER